MPATTQHLAELKDRYQLLKHDFQRRHKRAHHWLQDNNLELEELRQFSQQLLAAVSLAGQIAMSQPVEAQVQQQLQIIQQKHHNDLLGEISQQEYREIMQKMVSFVNMPPGHLEAQDELYLEQQLTDILGFEVTAELEGQRLNHSIGIMGGEQHLRRFPTDSLNQHDAFLEAGLAPQRGAFGWFTENGQLTQQAILREKYYFAVQTLYLPTWNQNYQQLKPWYKFRKMIVVNPVEQLAVVGVVGDAGPALSVKKQFGGSPEVMRQGKIWSPNARGRVMMFFIDDPNNQVPLGPIDLSWVEAGSEDSN
jgi:hypothetical protein